MWKAILLLSATALAARDRIAAIDFYGAKGLDTEALRRSLPARAGDPFVPRITNRAFHETILAAIGRDATEVACICCDPNGDTYIFIGLPGQSWKKFITNPPPTGAVRLSPALLDLQNRIEAAGNAATHAGGDSAVEDESLGYSLSHDPAERALQLQLRVYAVKHERKLLRAAAESSDALHRQYAVAALGYARQSPRQIAALVRASRDPNGGVRNDATRALGVLLEAKPALAAQVPAGVFIEMMSSGIWTDRNKACWVLDPMSRARDPKFLALLRAEALDPLIEMARWRSEGHASCGKSVLARLAGVPESEIPALSLAGADAILSLLKLPN